MIRIGNILANILSWAWLAKLLFGLGDEISPLGRPIVHIRMIQGQCYLIKGNVPVRVIKSVGEVFISANSENGYVEVVPQNGARSLLKL